MNILKISLYSFLLLLTFYNTQPVLAIEKTVTSAPASSRMVESSPVAVADVNVDQAKVTSQKGSTVNIDFTLSNGKGIQAGVKYSIELIKEGTQYVSDQKVYDDSITLYENTTVKKSIVYEAPHNLSGSYVLVLSVQNTGSLPLGIKTVGKVNLTASTKGIMILRDTCYLQVVREKGAPHYKLNQGVDIDANESLTLTCSAINEGTVGITANPKVETRYRNAFGEIVPSVWGTVNPVSFSKGEKKEFTITLPKVPKPQFYMAKVWLMNLDYSSNAVYLNYIIHGVKGTIYNINLDKDYYKNGEKGSLSILWSASAGVFARNSGGSTVPPEATLTATIKGDGASCTDTIKQKLVEDRNAGATIVPFTVSGDCSNPRISATLTDAGGTVLDQKDFTFMSDPTKTPHSTPQESKPISASVYGIVIVSVIALILLGLYLKKRSNPTINS